MCIKVYELDPADFLSAPGLAWQACLKKTEVELDLLTDDDMLLMVEKGIRGGICHAMHRYAKANNMYMKDYDKNEDSSFLEYLDVKNIYGWAMIQPLSVDGFKWVRNVSKIDEDFIISYDEDSDKGDILEVDIEYPKNLHDLHSDLRFLPERMKIDKCSKLECNLYDKETFFLLSGFSFTTIHESQDCRGRGRAFFLTPHYPFHRLHRHLDISRTITAESSPLHIASSRTRTGNLWFPSASR